MISGFLFHKVSTKYTSMILVNNIIQNISIVILILIIINQLNLNAHIVGLLQNQLKILYPQVIEYILNLKVNIDNSIPLTKLKDFLNTRVAIFMLILITITYIIEYVLYLQLYSVLSDYCYRQLLCTDYTNYNITEVFRKTKIGLYYLTQAFQSEIAICVKIILCLVISSMLLYYKQYIVVFGVVVCALIYVYIIYDILQKSKTTTCHVSQDTIYKDKDAQNIMIEDESYHLNADLCGNNCHYNWQSMWYIKFINLLISCVLVGLFNNDGSNYILIIIISVVYGIYISYEDWLHGLMFYQYWEKIPKYTWGSEHLQKPLTHIDIKNLCLQKTLDGVTFTTINNLNIRLNCNEFYTLEGFNNSEWQYLTNVISGEMGPNPSVFFNNFSHFKLSPVISNNIAVLHMDKKYKKTLKVIDYIHIIDPSLKKHQINKLMRLVGLHMNLNHKIVLYNSSEKRKFLLLELLVSLKRKRFIFVSKELVQYFDKKIIDYIRESRKYNNFALISNGDISHVADDARIVSLAI